MLPIPSLPLRSPATRSAYLSGCKGRAKAATAQKAYMGLLANGRVVRKRTAVLHAVQLLPEHPRHGVIRLPERRIGEGKPFFKVKAGIAVDIANLVLLFGIKLPVGLTRTGGLLLRPL